MTKKRVVRGKKSVTTPVKEETDKADVKDDQVDAETEELAVKEELETSAVEEEADENSSNQVKQEETVDEEEAGNVVIELQLSDPKESEENEDGERAVEEDSMFVSSHGGNMDEAPDTHEENKDNESKVETENTESKTASKIEKVEGTKENEETIREETADPAEEKKQLDTENNQSAAETGSKDVSDEKDKSSGTDVDSAEQKANITADKNEVADEDKSTKPEGDDAKVDAEDEEAGDDAEEENAEHHDEELAKEGARLSEGDKEMINEKFKIPPFPESLAKLTKLTVTIGPIQQIDLFSSELHKILGMIMDFEIKFEGKEKITRSGKTVLEKLGYVRTQFKIRTPTYLIRMATLLGNLNIRGRDMSVKFPEVFNMAVKDCKEYEAKNKGVISKIMKEKQAYLLDLKKRRILVKNIPENTTEDTMKALFPECLTVDFKEEESGNKKICCAVLTFENEKTCNECFESNKDVEIGDSKVLIKKLFEAKSGQFRRPGARPGWGARGGRGGFAGRGGGAPFRGGRSPNRGGSVASGRRPDIGNRPGAGPSPNKIATPPGKGKFSSNTNQQRNFPASNQQKKRSDSGPQSRPNQSRQSSDRRSLGSNMSSPKSQRPMTKTPESKGQMGGGFNNRQNRSNIRKGMNTGGGQNMQSQFQQSSFQSGNMMRNQQFGQSQDRNISMQGGSRNMGGEEDPMVMMAYLKNTIAKMEEKMTQRTDDSSRGGSYGGGDGGGFNNRKRRGGMMDQQTNAKRQHFQDRNMKSQGFQGSQQSYGGNSSYQDTSSFTGNNYSGNYSSSGNYSTGGQNYSSNNSYGGNAGSNFNTRGFGGNQGNRNNYSNQQSNSGRYGGSNW